MNIRTAIMIAAAMLFFGIVVVYISVSPVQAQCEVCLEFNGDEVCRSGAGVTQEEAREAAQESVCGGNTDGMAEAIVCRGRQPDRLTCEGPT